MGEVYLAQDQLLESKVAIRILDPEWRADKTVRERLIREAPAASTFEHPNICSIYEIGEENGLSFIVMQYVEGETLADRLRRKPLELCESLDISEQVAAALAEAHDRGIIHRQMQPKHILVNDLGQVKIMDFGLAIVMQHRYAKETDPRWGRMDGMATMPYFSPEQVSGKAFDDARSDIFSLGIVIYEMVTGRKPFSGFSLADIALALMTLDPPPLARYARHVPDELQRIVRKCLAKNIETRYQSARDLSADLLALKRDTTREA